jgi:hypothetical protein
MVKKYIIRNKDISAKMVRRISIRLVKSFYGYNEEKK